MEAAFSTGDTYLAEESVSVRYRIDLQEPVKEVWRSSMNGRPKSIETSMASYNASWRSPINLSSPAPERAFRMCRFAP